MGEYLFIQNVEKRDNEVVYWVGAKDHPRDFGVTFDDPITNSAREQVVEGIILALGVMSRIVTDL
jgi:hypothetical protein